MNKESIEKKLLKIKGKAGAILNRTLDQQVNIAVTGLSQSGKTAFITSLVNQLISENHQSELAFFTPIVEQRFIAAKRVPQQHDLVPRFTYDEGIERLSQNPPCFPKPTKRISELRLAIRYQPKSSLLKLATDVVTLNVDFIDYPGEWLLDLPMLNQTFEEWSQQTMKLLTQEPRLSAATDFIDQVNQLDPFAVMDEQQLADIAQQYTELLHTFRNDLGLSVIQPGRFILPGDMSGAPILQFFPFTRFDSLDKNDYQNADDNTIIGTLRARYIAYKANVVRKFYKQYFVNFDRQIVLCDCLSALNHGKASFDDLQLAIAMILESFDYGKSSLLKRLFSPKIDKLLFAATKADHVTPEQHANLVKLLNKMVYQKRHELHYQSVEVKTLALASIRTTQVGKSRYKNQQINVVKGKRVNDDKVITVFPGSVPSDVPTDSTWQESPFNFIQFAPQHPLKAHQALPHIRMDQALEFLLGDKMR
ncbi:YcjX family protein [Thalassotalea sp. LPB0316]|uniref:YcjX family protein n=1 Tax=Thalassotalea sp. LPB0316 TaxID=2769490 RepID=UPI0018664800|nr:YcjX family protein [Thalassotalea sp. LPB0316]QOL27142.1 YcjX family protein [Thalassotalea sp. LPB0316]